MALDRIMRNARSGGKPGQATETLYFVDDATGVEITISSHGDNVLPARLTDWERAQALIDALKSVSQWRAMSDAEIEGHQQRQAGLRKRDAAPIARITIER